MEIIKLPFSIIITEEKTITDSRNLQLQKRNSIQFNLRRKEQPRNFRNPRVPFEDLNKTDLHRVPVGVRLPFSESMAGGVPRRNYKERPQLVIEKRPPIIKENSPKTQSITRSVGGSIKKKKSNRESQSSKMAIQTFHCSKKEFKRGQVDIRSISDKFIYSAPFFQNANIERSQITSTSRLLDSVNRSSGRILAHSSDSQENIIPGIQVQRTGLAIQGNALWPKYRTKDVHQSDDSCHKGTSKFRNLVFDLPGRFANHCSYKRRMSPSSPTGTTSS